MAVNISNLAHIRKYVLDHHLAKTSAEIAADLQIPVYKVQETARKLRVKCAHPKVRGPYNKNKPQVPVPVHQFIREKKEYKRPPAVYTNSPSPYGIADELHRNNIHSL